VGDEVTTVGGIMGRIVSIKDDTIIIETGADRSKIRIKKWAIQTCDTIHEVIQ
jgi:preprotein translocase subunit YajC